MRIRSMTVATSASLPHVEKEEDAVTNDAKEKVFQLVKKLFKTTAVPKKLWEAYDKKKALTETRTKQAKELESRIKVSNQKLSSDITSLNDTLRANVTKLKEAIEGSMTTNEGKERNQDDD